MPQATVVTAGRCAAATKASSEAVMTFVSELAKMLKAAGAK